MTSATENTHKNASASTRRSAPPKLDFLESARGIAALVVVLHHVVLGFFLDAKFPSIELPIGVRSPRILIALAQSPLSVFMDGTFAVRFFFVLSGFVLSYSFFMKGGVADAQASARRRYLRLALPVAASVLFAKVLGSTIGFHGSEVANLIEQPADAWMRQSFVIPISLRSALFEASIGAFFRFKREGTLNPSLWTMSIELLNSYFVFAFLVLAGGVRYRALAYAGVAAVIFISPLPGFTLDFLCGIALCDLFASMNRDALKAAYVEFIGTACVLCGLFTGSIGPRLAQLTANPDPKRTEFYFQTVRAVLIVGGLLHSRLLQRLLERGPAAKLGKISFSPYLVHHPILASVATWTYVRLRLALDMPHLAAAVLAGVVTIGMSLGTAALAFRFVEQPAIGISRRL
ncbi:MAG: acyltransferase family protein [Polyangiales bacterium]